MKTWLIAKDARLGVDFKGMALRLRKTKTGPNQWVTVENKEVMHLLRDCRCFRKVWQVSLSCLHIYLTRRLFKSACSDLRLTRSYVPHSLRHGGATRQHLFGQSMEDILLRGRWASTKSARRYIQSGRAVLLSMDIPPALATCCPDSLPQHPRHFLAHTAALCERVEVLALTELPFVRLLFAQLATVCVGVGVCVCFGFCFVC